MRGVIDHILDNGPFYIALLICALGVGILHHIAQNEERCRADPDCVLVLRRADWTCTQVATIGTGKTRHVDCVQYTTGLVK